MNPFRSILAAAMLFAAAPAVCQDVPLGTKITSVTIAQATTAAPTVAEVSDFTAVADSSGSLSGKSFRFYSAGDAKCYQVWYDVDNASTAPTATTGCTLVPVDIATDDTNSTVAGNTRTALNTAPYTNYFTVTGSTTHVILTSLTKGAATDGNVGTSGFSVSKTQGVSSTAAIASASVLPNLMGWRICNNAVQSSTWLAVGKSALDTETDGIRLGKGKCFDCPSCTPASLKAAYVSSQAASGGYSVIQFK